MANPYKIFELYKMHDCEDAITGWTTSDCTVAVDTDCKEGKYSLKMVSTDVKATLIYEFDNAIDFSLLTYFRFQIKGDDCTLRFYVIDSVNNNAYWEVSMPQASWILNTEAITTPDNDEGVDFSNIKKIEFYIEEDAKTIYFDYIVAYKDITDDVYAPQVHRKVYEVSKGYFKSTLDISDDHCIEIYDENDNLKFEGNIQERSYGNIKEYKLIGFDAVIGDKVSGDYTAQTIEVITKALIDQVSYLRYITGSITTVAGNHTIKITERPFIEQLRKLADLFDGIGYISPDGVVYLDDGSTQCSEPEIHDAEYNFMDDANDVYDSTEEAEAIAGIDFIDSLDIPVGTTFSIISDLDGHKKVFKIDSDGSAIYCIHNFSATIANGTYEFYITVDDITNSDTSEFRILEGSIILIDFGIHEDDLMYYDGGWNLLKAACLANNTFLHVKIICNEAANNFECVVDEISEGNFGYRNNSVTGANRIQLVNAADKAVFLDAIGYSGDDDYTVGDNIDGFVANGKYGLLANNPLLEQIGKPINRIIAYGIMNVATGERLKTTANNESSQKLHGIIPFSVRAPHINNQTELDAFALTVLSRKGLTNSPKEIKLLKLINLYNLDNLFIGRTISFKLNAKTYAIYDYICLETYWRGESSILELYLSSGLLHSSEQDVDDSTVDEHQQDETGEAGYESDINTLDLQIREGANTLWQNWYLIMDAVADCAYGLFYVNNEVDDSRDIEITWTFLRADVNADTITIAKNIAAIKTDGSEAFSWNIDNMTADTLPACASGKFQKKTWIISAADFDIGDMIMVNLYINEASRRIDLHNLSIKYYIKRG